VDSIIFHICTRINVFDPENVGGGDEIAEAVWTATKGGIDEWTGGALKLRPSSLYGIRVRSTLSLSINFCYNDVAHRSFLEVRSTRRMQSYRLMLIDYVSCHMIHLVVSPYIEFLLHFLLFLKCNLLF
jgi:hypothetical protein